MKNINSLIYTKYSKFKKKINILYSNKTINILFFIAILSITMLMMYFLNNNTHFTSDDYRYHYIYESFMPTDSVKRIDSFKDIGTSMYNHYNMWGGRITAHTLVQTFLMLGKPIFNVLNSIAFVALSVLIYLHCNTFKKIKPSLMLAIVIMMWFWIPQFGATMLWVSGSGNYLWCSVIILIFLLPYRLNIEQKKYFKDNFINIVIMFLLGIIAGWTNENTGGGMILLQMLFMLYYFKNKINLPKWSISGLIGSIIGFILLVVAPGNYTRPNQGVSLIKRLGSLFTNSYETMFIPIVILTILLIIFINTTSKNRKKELLLPLMYFIVSIAAIGALILSPYAPKRTWFGPVVFIIISIGYIYSKLDFNNSIIKQISVICMILFTFSFTYEYAEKYQDIKTTYNQISKQIKLIEDEKAKGNSNITISKFKNPQSEYNAFKNTANLSKDKDSWFNSWMAKYYGVDSITSLN